MAQDPPDLRKDFNEAARGKPLQEQPKIDPAKGQPDKNAGPVIDSIKRHKPEQSFDMKGLGGPGVRQESAKAANAKDWDQFNSNRAQKYVNMDKKDIVGKGDVKDQHKGKLASVFNKESGRSI